MMFLQLQFVLRKRKKNQKGSKQAGKNGEESQHVLHSQKLLHLRSNVKQAVLIPPLFYMCSVHTRSV
jgi:hypothetical protein